MNAIERTTNDLIDRFFETINNADFLGFAACLAPDVHFEMIGSTVLSGTADTREGMLAVVGRVSQYVDDAFIHLEEVDRIVAGNRGVMRSHGTAHTRSGQPYNNTYLHTIKVKDAAIVEFIEYLDTDLINRVLLADS